MSSSVYEGHRSDHGSKSSELKSSLDPLIKNEIERNVVEIKAEAFIRAFLYPSSRLGEPNPAMVRDHGLAEACHDMLKQGSSDDDLLMSMLTDASCPKYSNNTFTLLDPNVEREKDLYTPFRKLFTFISEFYRLSLPNQSPPLDIDAAWPDAVDPKPGHTASPTNSLRRDFFDTHNMMLRFSPRLVEETADLRPDLVLMLHRNKDPDTKQPSVYWKDVKVPIEVKKDFHSEGDIIAQVARYARAILMEQFDRKFVITVLLSATQCRLFHWDSVGCHVTEPIDIHKDPILLIRCIARLAMMTPEELGYDDHFSNAGRVLSDQYITTTLTVRDSPIRQYLDREPSSQETSLETATSMLLELDTEKFLFESRGMLFHRHTKVWRGKEITDVATWKTGVTRVVKQNWAEDTRPSEGYLYKLANNIPTVCSLVLMEECDHTWGYHNRVAQQDVVGYLNAAETKEYRQPRRTPGGQGEEDVLDSGPNPLQNVNIADRRSCTPLNPSSDRMESLERVLLRFVFAEEYRPLRKASKSLEVLDATVQWIEGLIALDRLGIVHRDVSYSNLMLPLIDQDSDGTKLAKIIDLGLAHVKDIQSSDEPPSRVPGTPSSHQESVSKSRTLTDKEDSPSPDPRAHHHITGTLPFIALDLIDQLRPRPSRRFIEHALHHDVESVFWVLVYLCHVKANPKPKGLMGDTLRGLISPDIGFVAATKMAILGRDRKSLTEIVGPFYELRDFLKAFADYHHSCSEREQPIDVSKVLDMAIEHRDKLAKSGKENASTATVHGQQLAPMTPPHNNTSFDSPKRKFSTLENTLETGDWEEEVFEEELGTPRKKTKQDSSVHSLMPS